MKEKQANNSRNYRKNEIQAACTQCGTEKLVAYWDHELEHYIYLADEPVVCSACSE